MPSPGTVEHFHPAGGPGIRVETHVYQGYRDKLPAYEKLLQDTGLEAAQTAYVGDDLIDLPVMTRCGLGICVADAHRDLESGSTIGKLALVP